MTRAQEREAEREKVRARLRSVPPEKVATIEATPVPVPVTAPAGRAVQVEPAAGKRRGALVRVDSLRPATDENVTPAECRALIARDRGPDLLIEVQRVGAMSVYIRQVSGSGLFTEPYGCIAAASMVHRLPD